MRSPRRRDSPGSTDPAATARLSSPRRRPFRQRTLSAASAPSPRRLGSPWPGTPRTCRPKRVGPSPRLRLADSPSEVAEVVALARAAEQQSASAFSVHLPGPNGRRRFDPSGVVKGWAVERAARLLTTLDDTDVCLSAGGDMVCRSHRPRPADLAGRD